MEALIVEIVTRPGAAEFHKADRYPLRIGRAFDNDLVLADPFVSPHHVVIEPSDEGWIVVDQNSKNGTFTMQGTIARGPVEIKSGGQFLIGRTLVRLWSPAHEVPEAQPLPRRKSRLERTLIPVLAVASICITAAFLMVTGFLETTKQPKLLSLFSNALPLCAFPFLWAGIWASAGFIIRRKSSYGHQLLLANGAFVGITLLTILSEYIDYWTNSVGFADFIQFASMALLGTVLLYVNIRIATGTGNLRRAVISFVISGAVITAIALSDRAERYENRGTPQYSRTVKPPYAKLAKSVSLEEFIKDGEKLFKEEKTGTRSQ
jgi:hypothetical protein